MDTLERLIRAAPFAAYTALATSGRIAMFREFSKACAWTDAMCEDGQCVGLIEYQVVRERASVEVLWVFAPGCTSTAEAEAAAERMLQHIREIGADGRVYFDDGVSLQEELTWPV